ncbi:hypothetical protein [Rhizobium sp. AC27/96]|uniref:hypothetical protein n=1 Tax=Rhizobium sp. AC27/96 TaxID=1841653 RepID=UPI001FCDC415|nr:hypothetical protein [Rhizobium sp. AC27/96]
MIEIISNPRETAHDLSVLDFFKPTHLRKHEPMSAQESRQQLLMEIEMFKTFKPAIMFALVGTTFAALAVSSVPGVAATTCATDLRLTRTELSEAPDGQQKTEAIGLYSAALNARRDGQDGQCLGDLNRASTVLAYASLYPVDAGNVGVNPASTPSTPEHGHGNGDHHGHGHH